MAIDWSLAKQPDIIGNAYAAMRQGEAAGREQQARNAYATYAVDPEAGIKALMPYDPAAATQLATTRRQEKRQDTADALAMSDRQKKEASERAGMLASYAQSLKTLPPEQRKAALANDAPQLIERGLTAEMIQSFDPSDQNIDKVATEALGIKDKLDLDLKRQTFQAGREDEQFDREFKGKQFAETVRGNRVQEGQGAARLGLERERVGIARQSAAQVGQASTVKLTEAQARDGFNAKRIAASNRIMTGLEGQRGFDPTMAAVAGAVGQGAARRYEQAKEEWADSIIRLTTGAAATKPEIDAAKKAYFAAPFDDASVVKQKREARERVEQDALFRAGNGATGGSANGSAAPAAPSGGGAVLRFDARGNRIK